MEIIATIASVIAALAAIITLCFTYKTSRTNIRKKIACKNKKISDFASKRTGNKNSFYGKTHSEETRKILSEKKIKYIRIGMFDLETKQLIAEFNNVPEAAMYVIKNNISNSSLSSIKNRIKCVCKLNTDYNRAYGYNWRYL